MIDGLFRSRYMTESDISKLTCWGFDKINNREIMNKTRTARNTNGNETRGGVSNEVRV